MDNTPTLTVPVIPADQVTALQRLSNGASVTDLVERSQTLLALIEVEGASASVTQAAAQLYAALAGPGASDLDLRPGSLEIVGDEALHVRAMAEAKARAVDGEVARAAARAALPADVQAKVVDYDTREAAHREGIANAYDEGIIRGRFEARTEHDATPLWKIAQRRLAAAVRRALAWLSRTTTW